MDLASLATGVGIAGAAGAGAVWLASLFRRAGQVEAKLDGTADSTQRTAAQHDRDIEKLEAALMEHRREARESAAELRADIGARFDRQAETLDKITSGLGSLRQTVAAHDATVEQLDKRVGRIEARSSGPIQAKGGT